MKIESVIAASRFGLGARPGDYNTIDRNAKSWLVDQLQGPSRVASEIQSLPDSASVLVEFQAIIEKRRDLRAESNSPAPDIVEKVGGTLRHHYLQQTEARYRAACASDHPFHERLVHFWANHFAVSADKPPLPALAGLYENEAIRPNIGGSFADLLIAAESHPAMIVYLDNQRSVGPGSRLGKRAGTRRNNQSVGLNENLAREILELHTLGVDGGYTQDDVQSLAKIITGWSVGGGRGPLRDGTPGEFTFRTAIHEPGTQSLLGRQYAQQGMDQGVAVLRDLASHPSTARFIATKLARHFIADDPPAAAVDRIASVFLDTNGHLPSVHRAVVDSAEAWQAPLAKFKSPQDYVISAFRAFDRVPDDARFVVGALDMMGQTPFRPGSPAGWGDTIDSWGGADALYKRIEWADTVGRLAGDRVNPSVLAESLLGPVMDSHTRESIARAESTQQGLTLFLVAPEFQRR